MKTQPDLAKTTATTMITKKEKEKIKEKIPESVRAVTARTERTSCRILSFLKRAQKQHAGAPVYMSQVHKSDLIKDVLALRPADAPKHAGGVFLHRDM